MDDIGKRIRALRRGTPRKDFAERFGISAKTLQRYEDGERVPADSFADQVIAAFELSPSWLHKGEGPMYAAEVDRIKTESGQGATGAVLRENEALRAMLALQKENADLLRENGNLRVENERLAVRNAELERQLAEALKPAQPAPVGNGISRVG